MNLQTRVFAGGCFWCTEAVFEQLKGVSDVTAGYAGGDADDADYTTVCSGSTNHAEAIRISFDADVISPQTLLEVFFLLAHDPTQEGGQGNDIGNQYRSAIFYADEDERHQAASYITALEAAGKQTLTTSLEPLDSFYTAEEYHQGYAGNNPDQPYIFCVAKPKVDKLKKLRPELLKTPL